MNKIWLQDMTWEEAEEGVERSGGLAIIPVGSIEQHGRHLPLGTDSFVPIALAEDVAKRTGAVVTPPLWFGWSPHHMALTGTITLRPEILTEVIVDVCRSLVHHGFRKIIIINGHRVANLPPIQQAAWKIKVETGALVEIVDPAYMGETISRKLNISEEGHADEFETSHMLFIRPELVKVDRAVKHIPPPRKFHLTHLIPGDRLVWSPPAVPSAEEIKKIKASSGGTSGDPTRATKEKGKEIHKAIVNNIIELIEELKKE